MIWLLHSKGCDILAGISCKNYREIYFCRSSRFLQGAKPNKMTQLVLVCFKVLAQVPVPEAVRPNKPKSQSLEQRSVYCKGQARRMLKGPEFPKSFLGRVFIGKFRGRGCRECGLPLIGWWWIKRVVGQETQSSAFWVQLKGVHMLLLSLKLPYSTWLGALVHVEELKRSVSNWYAVPEGRGLGGGIWTRPYLHYCFFLHSLTSQLVTTSTLELREGQEQRMFINGAMAE